jgi:DNA processing protein
LTPMQLRPEGLLGALSAAERKGAPPWIYTGGQIEFLDSEPRIAIIGSRKASEAGIRRARKLASLLSREGIVTVSGLAAGVDTAAHEATIAAGGRTIAVLGTPLDTCYPPENEALQEEIIAEHLAISPFAPGSAIHKSNFPYRNLVMALFSTATVIVEASDTSGTLHQARECLRIGRQLFILKSVAEDERLSWPAVMLAGGAKILDGFESFLDFIAPGHA